LRSPTKIPRYSLLAENTDLLAAVSIVLVMVISYALLGCGGSYPRNPPADHVDAARAWEKAHNKEVLQQKEAPIYDYEIINTYDHDVNNFTEGLVMDGGLLYEGTGLYDQSSLLKSELETGDVLRRHDLDPEHFGEGVTVFGDKVFQLTYLSNTGFVYDKESFKLLKTFEYPTQGWGLTDNGEELIMSDGSAALHFLDPETLEETRYITVSDNEGTVGNLNELEYIDGEIYANLFKTSLVAIISPDTGEVTGWINLAGINPDPAALKDPYVLNGIAYRQETGRLLVTGKCWPTIFEIELVESSI